MTFVGSARPWIRVGDQPSCPRASTHEDKQRLSPRGQPRGEHDHSGSALAGNTSPGAGPETGHPLVFCKRYDETGGGTVQAVPPPARRVRRSLLGAGIALVAAILLAGIAAEVGAAGQRAQDEGAGQHQHRNTLHGSIPSDSLPRAGAAIEGLWFLGLPQSRSRRSAADARPSTRAVKRLPRSGPGSTRQNEEGAQHAYVLRPIGLRGVRRGSPDALAGVLTAGGAGTATAGAATTTTSRGGRVVVADALARSRAAGADVHGLAARVRLTAAATEGRAARHESKNTNERDRENDLLHRIASSLGDPSLRRVRVPKLLPRI